MSGTTSNIQLINLCKYLKIHLVGVFMKDMLPALPSNGFYIINLQNSDCEGTHWTSLILDDRNALYVDSYGMPPSIEVEDFIRKSNPRRIYGYNTTHYQSLHSTNCGFFCVFLFNYIKNSKSGDLFQKANNFINCFNINNEAKKNNININDSILRAMGIPYMKNKVIASVLLSEKRA